MCLNLRTHSPVRPRGNEQCSNAAPLCWKIKQMNISAPLGGTDLTQILNDYSNILHNRFLINSHKIKYFNTEFLEEHVCKWGWESINQKHLEYKLPLRSSVPSSLYISLSPEITVLWPLISHTLGEKQAEITSHIPSDTHVPFVGCGRLGLLKGKDVWGLGDHVASWHGFHPHCTSLLQVIFYFTKPNV